MTLAEIAAARDAVHAARVANSAERRRLLSVGASFPERQALAVKATELARQARALREAHWAAIDAAYPSVFAPSLF
jgi:hypothetical protein